MTISGSASIASFAEIVEREAQGEQHIRLFAPLTFLWPRIIPAIVDGTAPADLTVTSLAKALPYSQAQQERAIVFTSCRNPVRGRAMEKDRLGAFSDGVIAIIITIMVLELKVPHDATLDALVAVTPAFLSYALSFVYVAIYWNNHHHFFHLVRHVSGMMLWANMHLLFWLSLIPFATGWMGENHFAPVPTAVYGGRDKSIRVCRRSLDHGHQLERTTLVWPAKR